MPAVLYNYAYLTFQNTIIFDIFGKPKYAMCNVYQICFNHLFLRQIHECAMLTCEDPWLRG